MTHIEVTREGDFVYLDCTANAFLHHMVRNIVGSLVRIGLGEESVGWLGVTRAAGDRKLAGMTAPAACRSSTNEDHGVTASPAAPIAVVRRKFLRFNMRHLPQNYYGSYIRIVLHD